MAKKIDRIKEIVESNGDLKERMIKEKWTVSYNRDADMLIMGGEFSNGSFYYSIDDCGGMIRIDKQNKIQGFAIENTKEFVKQTPEMSLFINFYVHPYRTRYITFPSLFIKYNATRSIDVMKSMFSMSDYVAGKAAYC